MAQIKYLDNEQFINDIVELVESNSINFLVGAGFSAPILRTLGNIEKIMEIIKKHTTNKFIALEGILYWELFKKSIYPIKKEANKIVLKNQIEFVDILKQILNKRQSATLLKQINIFTTNYDVFLEVAFEEANIDYNDGFIGRIMPYFSTAHYNKIFQKQVLFSNRVTEVPVINLFKVHGSITWKKYNESKFVYGNYIESLEDFNTRGHNLICTREEDIREIWEKIEERQWEDVDNDFVNELVENLDVTDDELVNVWKLLIETYQSTFKIVSPTKEKFNDTLLDKNYYELLRIYSNELEKTNAILIVFGFSFADEHIQEITMRALNNPSLIVIIFAYQLKDISTYQDKFEVYNNVWIISLNQETQYINNDGVIQNDEVACTKDEIKLDLVQFNNFLKSSILINKEK